MDAHRSDAGDESWSAITSRLLLQRNLARADAARLKECCDQVSEEFMIVFDDAVGEMLQQVEVDHPSSQSLLAEASLNLRKILERRLAD